MPRPFSREEDNTFSEALELSGTPFPYFPEMIPQARGDHVIAPTPTEEKTFSEKILSCANKVKSVRVLKQNLISCGKKLAR